MTKLEKVLSLTKLQAKTLHFINFNTGVIDGWYHTMSVNDLKNRHLSASKYMIKSAIKKLIELNLIERDLYASGRAFQYSII